MDRTSDNDRLAKYLAEHCGPHCYGEQDENGIDLSLIRENLELSPLERIRKADAAETDVRMLREIGRRQFQGKV
jgi:hypothetical protein